MKKAINIFLIFLFGLYLSIIATLTFVCENVSINVLKYIVILVVSIVLSFGLIRFLANKILNINLNKHDVSKNNKKIFFGFFISMFIVYMIWFLIYYPGGLTPDSYTQMIQGLGYFSIDNWFPILDTFFFFRVPMLLIDKVWFLNFFQIFLFTISYAYLLTKMYKYGCNRIFLAISFLYAVTNFYLITFIITAMKDMHFTIFAIALTAQVIEIYNTNGKWLNKNSNLFAFVFFAFFTQFVKRNGLLFVLPIMIYGFLKCDKFKKRIAGAIYAGFFIAYLIASNFVVKDYSYVIETMGVPINVWGNVLKNDASSLPKKTLDEISYLIPVEDAKEYFMLRAGNSIKNRMSYSKINSYGHFKCIDLMLKCFVYSPKYSYESVFHLMSLPLGISFKNTMYVNYMLDVISEWYDTSNVPDFSKKYKDKLNSFFPRKQIEWEEKKKIYDTHSFIIIFGSLGLKILVICYLFIILAYKRNIKAVFALPLIFNHFGTALLFTDIIDYRYFITLLPLWLPFIYLILSNPNIIIEKRKRRKPNRIEAK